MIRLSRPAPRGVLSSVPKDNMATEADPVAAKRAELMRLVADALGDQLSPDHQQTLDGALASLLKVGVRIRAPEYPKLETRLELFTLRSTRPQPVRS